MRRNRKLETPTFAQTVRLIQTLPLAARQDVEAIIQQHLAQGFTYNKEQIYRAVKALTDPARGWAPRNRRSAPWT